ncbi:MAG TPA: TonB-dependent receptor plug domain-containing protein, partial [Blastocatellia bacterium]|nr:TonB-dependent receptor plug domain-containing protein [Blastocatellia bacterium]
MLTGTVTDSRGGVVNGARVILLYVNRIVVDEQVTNKRGEFRFNNLRPGNYSIAVEAVGLSQSGGTQPVKVRGGVLFGIMIPMTVAAGKDTLLVSATRTESLLGETASSAYVVPSTNLMRAQSVNVSDSLRFTPGVTVIQTGRRGGATTLYVRGGEADYTKVLIDGVPVNDAGGSFNFADLTTDNTSRIELVRGTQSAIYGSDAMGGVLQIFTHRGTTPRPEFEFSSEGGSFGYNRHYSRLSGDRGPLDYSLSFSRLSNLGRDRNDKYQNRVFTGNFGYRLNEGRQFRLTTRRDSAGMGI